MNLNIRALTLTVCTMTLCGCALTEYALLSGGSYILTGRSLADNALSVATDMDCKSHNVLYGESICRPYSKDVLIAESEAGVQQQTISASDIELLSLNYQPDAVMSVELAELSLAFSDKEVNIADIVDPTSIALIVTDVEQNTIRSLEHKIDNSTLSGVQGDSLTPLTEKAHTQERHFKNRYLDYAVVGSFTDLKYAKYRQDLYSKFDAQILPFLSDNGTAFRVIVGPLSHPSEITSIPSKKDTEIFEPWIISLCGGSDGLNGSNCSKGDNSLLATNTAD